MTKKIFLMTLSFLLILTLSLSSFADQDNASFERIELQNGYATITTFVDNVSSRASTRRASKVYRAYNFHDELLWTYTLNGTFTYDGSSSKAIGASDTYSIIDREWSNDYTSTDYSGRTVYGEAAFSCPTDDLSCHLSITCSANGVIS